MELTIRDWMVIIGVLLILAVGLDAWRRVRGERRSTRVKVKLAATQQQPGGISQRDADLAWLRELPNGGARVIDRRDLIKAAAQSASDVARQDITESSSERPAQKAEQRPAPPERTASAEARSKPAPQEPPLPSDEDELMAGMSAAEPTDTPETLDWLEGMEAGPGEPADPRPAAGKLPRDVDPEVFMLNVVARNPQGFRGDDILHILLACDLRFGDMNFFHRHESEAGRGAIQFSVANMMRPGVFDIDNMSDFDTPGLVFFLTLPGPEDMMKAFDYMLETAQAVARNLDGDVLDESRSVLTPQTLGHCRQQIRDLERRLLARAR